MNRGSRYKQMTVLLLGLMMVLACGGETQRAPESPPAKPASEPVAEPATVPPAEELPQAAIDGSATIRGTVKFVGNVPKLRPIPMDGDPGCAKKHSTPVMSESLVLGEGNTLGNVFVRVKSGLPAVRFPAPSQPVVLDQLGCRYHPHVVGVLIDQPFKILNSDGLLHNVHALPKINSGFNRAMPANVKQAEYSFSKEEFMFRIKCDVHPWMGAYVAVMSHPFFAVSQEQGQYEIAGLPAGSYEIEAWHEKLGVRPVSVTLADGETRALDFTFER